MEVPTYFNKCFHEYFGVTPGEFKKGEGEKLNNIPASKLNFSNVSFFIIGLVLMLVFGFLYLDGKLFALKKASQVEISIAVRPFNYLAGNSEKEYLANALMLEIVNQLSQINDLRVMSSTSVLPYVNQTDKVIGKKINCLFILHGNLYVEQDKMNLILTLVDAEDGSVVESFGYKPELDDIIELPGIIAQSVAKELRVELSDAEKDRIEKVPTLNLTAYDFFQRGREEHFKYWASYNNMESLNMAEKFYNKALEYDSTFARAYTGLAMVYWEKNYWTNYFKHNFLDSVQILVNKALSFDSELSEAYVIKGEYLKAYGFIRDAEKEYDKALALNPNEWMAYMGKAFLYSDFDILGSIQNLHHGFGIYVKITFAYNFNP